MRGVVAEDTLRRALKVIDERTGTKWLSDHIGRTVLGLLDCPWILDVDVTIKPLYGKQQGAVVGYNPHKPGRPSHAYHSYQVSGLRLMLGVDVLAGNQSHANHTLPGLVRILDGLVGEKRPRLVRGDAGLAGEPLLCALEERGQRYLFKLRLTQNVKRYIEKLFWEKDWIKAGQGWEGKDGELRLDGWSRLRRVVVLRCPLRGDALLADESQSMLAFIEANVPAKRYEYAVLVTDLNHELFTIAQLYRDRGDAENTFDELKNQWGWGGFTTQDLARCRLPWQWRWSTIGGVYLCGWATPKLDWKRLPADRFCFLRWHARPRMAVPSISPSLLSMLRPTKQSRCSRVSMRSSTDSKALRSS